MRVALSSLESQMARLRIICGFLFDCDKAFMPHRRRQRLEKEGSATALCLHRLFARQN